MTENVAPHRYGQGLAGRRKAALQNAETRQKTDRKQTDCSDKRARWQCFNTNLQW
jgi:hypothetical protein